MTMESYGKMNERLQNDPYYTCGEVVKGFGRGSKDLGIPTANFPEAVIENLPSDISSGIYFGWASVDNKEIHKMVVSIGWNPYYNNEKKSVETHIIHTFENDFYGAKLNIVIIGYIRPEKDFASLEELVSAIHNDIKIANEQLDLPEMEKFKSHLQDS